MPKRDIWTFRPNKNLQDELDRLSELMDYENRTDALEDLLNEGIKSRKRKVSLMLTILFMVTIMSGWTMM